MNFLSFLGALVLSYYRPHAQADWLKQAFSPYARWLERNCNDGKNRHGVIAWVLGVLLPTLVIGITYYILLEIHAILGILFGIAVLYFTLRFSLFGQSAEKIVAALRDRNMDQARELFSRWEGSEAENYSAAE